MTGAATAAVFGCEGLVLGEGEAAFFREVQPWGFILFARNVASPDQLRRLTDDLQQTAGRQVPIFVDQEGGRVQRLRAPHWHEWTPPLDFVQAAGAHAAAAMRLRYRLIARELRDVGITGNCAPTADLAFEQTHPFLRNRCYATDPQAVSRISRAVAQGLMDEGIWPVVKHLPGHGRSIADTHLDLPTVTASRQDLQALDFAPFKALADLPYAMTAHIIYQAYDSLPATQSARMIDVIRNEIGFQGLLMTDDLNMQALKGSLAERTAASMAAGCDLALHCKGDLAEMQQVARAAGAPRADTLQRAKAVLKPLIPAAPIDTSTLRAELQDLIASQDAP